jgi:hypothetical protein
MYFAKENSILNRSIRLSGGELKVLPLKAANLKTQHGDHFLRKMEKLPVV